MRHIHYAGSVSWPLRVVVEVAVVAAAAAVVAGGADEDVTAPAAVVPVAAAAPASVPDCLACSLRWRLFWSAKHNSA